MKNNYEVLRKSLLQIAKISDPQELLSLWNETKLQMLLSLENGLHNEAWVLAKDYAESFHRYKHLDEEVTRQVIALFPVNEPCTFKLLGIADDIDDYILNHKLKIQDLTQTKRHGFCEVLDWALARGQRDLIERIVTQVRDDLINNYPTSQNAWNEALQGMLMCLIGSPSSYMDLSDVTDRAMSDLVIIAYDYPKQAADMIGLARSGMSKTLIKLLSVWGFKEKYGVSEFSAEDFDCILNALPKNPSPAELHWIQTAIAVPGLHEKILFDPSVDMDAYIQAMNSDSFGALASRHNRTITAIEPFAPLMTQKHLNTRERRLRASKLLNVVCESQSPPERKDPDMLRRRFKESGFDPYVFKLCDQLKASVLEHDLGM